MADSITTILAEVHCVNVIPAEDVQEGYNYLSRQQPKQVAKILADWYTPIRNGCTNRTMAESISMIELISKFLWEVCTSGFAKKVMDELEELHQWDVIESVNEKHDQWEVLQTNEINEMIVNSL